MPLDLYGFGTLKAGSARARSADPTSVAGLLAWWDPQSSYMSLTGSQVNSWTSREGNAYVVSQAGANRPTWSATQILSKPGVLFTRASQQYLSGAAALAPLIDQRAPFTLLTVIDILVLSSNGMVLSACASGNRQVESGHLSTGALIEQIADGAGVITSATGVIGVAPASVAWRYTGSAGNFRVNGVNKTGGSSTVNTSVCDSVIIGASKTLGSSITWLNGALGDVCVYNSSLSDSDCTIVENYFRAKYPGLP